MKHILGLVVASHKHNKCPESEFHFMRKRNNDTFDGQPKPSTTNSWERSHQKVCDFYALEQFSIVHVCCFFLFFIKSSPLLRFCHRLLISLSRCPYLSFQRNNLPSHTIVCQTFHPMLTIGCVHIFFCCGQSVVYTTNPVPGTKATLKAMKTTKMTQKAVKEGTNIVPVPTIEMKEVIIDCLVLPETLWSTCSVRWFV
jgi:hypothetical protein